MKRRQIYADSDRHRHGRRPRDQPLVEIVLRRHHSARFAGFARKPDLRRTLGAREPSRNRGLSRVTDELFRSELEPLPTRRHPKDPQPAIIFYLVRSSREPMLRSRNQLPFRAEHQLRLSRQRSYRPRHGKLLLPLPFPIRQARDTRDVSSLKGKSLLFPGTPNEVHHLDRPVFRP